MRIKTNTNNVASPRPSQAFADRVRTLARRIPAVKEMEIHTKGMDGIVH